MPEDPAITGVNSDGLTITDGVDAWHASGSASISPFDVIINHEGSTLQFYPVDIPEARSTELSANGICAIVNYSGTFYTWGDHTSAFSAGTVSDERARFDNTIRMQIMITNRFQMKYRTSVDAPMTLQMRDDVINEELDFLASLVAIGALIGEPVCEFSPLDNPVDGVAQGQFVWKIADTPTIPFKFGNLKVAYTQAGLSVYMQ
jgi:phage tail sheath protein FI